MINKNSETIEQDPAQPYGLPRVGGFTTRATGGRVDFVPQTSEKPSSSEELAVDIAPPEGITRPDITSELRD